MPNAMMVIVPRYDEEARTWVFDDPAAGLCREPFVCGTERILDQLVERLPDARNGFRLLFSAESFPGHQVSAHRTHREGGGAWYRCEHFEMEGWLCPATLHYFADFPERVYVRAEALADTAEAA